MQQRDRDDCDRQRGEPEGVPVGRPGPHHQDPQPGPAGRQLQAAQEGRQRGDYCTHYKYYDSEGFVVEFLENNEVFQSVKAIFGGLLHKNSLKYLI